MCKVLMHASAPLLGEVAEVGQGSTDGVCSGVQVPVSSSLQLLKGSRKNGPCESMALMEYLPVCFQHSGCLLVPCWRD